MESLFWQRLDELAASSELVIDRPRGSAHPNYPDFIYPFDYGYLRGTLSMDQDGIDVWAGSLPARRVTGVICTIDLMKKNAEIKVLLGCTPAEAEIILDAHNSGLQSGLLVMRQEI